MYSDYDVRINQNLVCCCGIPERCDVSACACPAGIPHGRLPGIVDSGIALNELPDGTAFQVQ